MIRVISLPKEESISYYLSGATLDDVGRKYGCCAETVRRRFTEWDVHIRLKPEYPGIKQHLDKYRAKAIEERRKNPPKGELNPKWKGGRLHYFKQSVLARDGRICTLCGYDEHPEIIEVHHRDGNHHNNVLENGIGVCPNCHRIEEFKNGTFHTRLRAKRYEK